MNFHIVSVCFSWCILRKQETLCNSGYSSLNKYHCQGNSLKSLILVYIFGPIPIGKIKSEISLAGDKNKTSGKNRKLKQKSPVDVNVTSFMFRRNIWDVKVFFLLLFFFPLGSFGVIHPNHFNKAQYCTCIVIFEV